MRKICYQQLVFKLTQLKPLADTCYVPSVKVGIMTGEDVVWYTIWPSSMAAQVSLSQAHTYAELYALI